MPIVLACSGAWQVVPAAQELLVLGSASAVPAASLQHCSSGSTGASNHQAASAISTEPRTRRALSLVHVCSVLVNMYSAADCASCHSSPSPHPAACLDLQRDS
jgi:hypothetical protein